jgi:hypothetical protein
MRRTRRVWWKAAGLLLAATAASPALAQGVPGAVALPDNTPPRVLPPGDVEMLPAPRSEELPAPQVRPAPAPARAATPTSPGCGSGCEAKGSVSGFQRWRAEKHASCQAHLWGYPAEFEAPPLGSTIHAHFRTMVANGEAAAMVLYHCDFVDGSNALNLHGRDQLTRIAAMMGANPAPIVIERTPGAPGLAEARRAAILNVFAANNIPVPPDRVLIGPSLASGLTGTDSQVLYLGSLTNLNAQGRPLLPPSRGAASSSGTGGGGGGTVGSGQ